MAMAIGTDLETAMRSSNATIRAVAARASVTPSTVVRVIRGDGGVHLHTLCAIGAAVGLRISVKAYPAAEPSLRDSGQLRMAEWLIAQAEASWQPALELPVGDPFGRAADLVFFGPAEIAHLELETGPADWQRTLRAATVKRDSLQAQHERPVRLVIALNDTRRNRRLVEPHADLIRAVLPAGSNRILDALRRGEPIGRDGLLWVRPWRTHPG